MKNINLVLVFLLAIVLQSFAQEEMPAPPSEEYKHVIKAINGPDGNYLYLYRTDQIGEIKPTDVFEIERRIAGEQTSKQIGTHQRVQTYTDFKQFYSDEDLLEMQKNLDGSEEDLLNKFTSFSTPEDLFVYYGFIETKQALGMVFHDKNVVDGTLYFYKITKQSLGAQPEVWGYGLCRGGMGNYALPQLRPVWSGAKGRDSLTSLQWSLTIDQNVIDGLKMKNLYPDKKEINEAIHALPYSPKAVRARVMVENNRQWEEKGIIFPKYDESEDVLTFSFTQDAIPEQATRAYIILEDEVYNLGMPSDTAIVFSVDSMSARLIYGINVTDTLNGIHLAWEQLPIKPYYSGIEILRFDSNDELDTVAVLGPQEKEFVDRKVEVGNHYRYQVKALFVPQKGLEQIVPAQGVGTYSKFTKPLPPTNLKGGTEGKYIKLDWEYVDEPSHYAFYVYRGTSSKKLELCAGPILEKTYTDTLEALNGRTDYFYVVNSQNYRQDTSSYSNMISVRPDKPIEMSVVETIDLYYANNEMRLDWRDLRKGNNAIKGYILQRRAGDETDFKTIHEGVLLKSAYIDSGIEFGKNYAYRVAATSIYGDQGEFSLPFSKVVEKSKVATINQFFVRNTSQGIVVSLPKMVVSDRESYVIYKRESTQEEFQKLATIPANKFEYLDTVVSSDKLYVYKVTTIEKDGREGPKGSSKTIRVK